MNYHELVNPQAFEHEEPGVIFYMDGEDKEDKGIILSILLIDVNTFCMACGQAFVVSSAPCRTTCLRPL